MYLKLQPSVQKRLLTPSVIPNLEQKAITNTAREFMAEAGSISQLQERWPDLDSFMVQTGTGTYVIICSC